MKKLVFFQRSIILYLLLTLFLFIIIAELYVLIDMIIKIMAGQLNDATIWYWIAIVAAIGVGIFMVYTFLRFAKNRIILDEQEIFVPGNWGGKEVKIQFETHISYHEIKDIFLVISHNNSQNKCLKWGTLPMPYIVFECEDGTQKNINVFFYSKKQTIKIIDEAILRAKYCGNELHIKTGKELLSEFLDKTKTKR